MPIRLISLNIEGDNHYEKIFPLFAAEQPDVVCLMELFEVDIPRFTEVFGMSYVYLVNAQITKENLYRLSPKGSEGIGIFSKYPLLARGLAHYDTYCEPDTGISAPNTGKRGLVWADIKKDDEVYRIVATHFTWSPGGSVTDLQRADLKAMSTKLKKLGEHVLCGDFNAPREKEIFSTLESIYKDNIPPDVVTTIDHTLHRVGDKVPPLVVDALFTTKRYRASDVRVVSGVSDHCAIVARIERVA